jgi:pimeloyl-ACP methyl ester carboxylesterase
MIIDGVELATTWIGTPAPRALVFLHEGLGSIAQWRDTPAAIAAATVLPAFIYERQGHGSSSPVALPRSLSYMHDEAARLPAILTAAGITQPILVGHSDGASIAIIAASVVQPVAMVLIAPHVFVEKVSVEAITAAAVAFRTGDLRARLAKHHAHVDSMFWGWNRAWLDPEFREWNLEGLLPAIACPVLVVQGERDEYGTDAQVLAISQLVRHSSVMRVPNAGHSPFRDAPDEVHARIAAFINAV